MLRIETVRPQLLARLRELMAIEELAQFYLVGGTGLSLLFGHRDSVDIDLFTNIQLVEIKKFISEKIIAYLKK